jgi:F-type H+-transporting ATPase subunit b
VIAPVTQFAAEEASGIGALGIDGKAFIIQLVTFVLAFLVLQKFAFKPILKVMDQRRKTIEDGVKIGEDMKKQQAELTKKVDAELAKARSEADGVIAGAQEAARQVAADAETKATKKTEVMLAEAKSRIQQEEARSRKRIMGDVVGLISEATEAIIDEKVDAKKDAQLIDKALKGQA